MDKLYAVTYRPIAGDLNRIRTAYAAGKDEKDACANIIGQLTDTAALTDCLIDVREVKVPGYRITVESAEPSTSAIAAKINQFVYETDPYSYNDAVESREEGLSEVRTAIENGNCQDIMFWLADTVCLHDDPETANEANELLSELLKVVQKYA